MRDFAGSQTAMRSETGDRSFAPIKAETIQFCAVCVASFSDGYNTYTSGVPILSDTYMTNKEILNRFRALARGLISNLKSKEALEPLDEMN
ncbi:hypothetical protein [Leptolyngbya boryana]|uniref:hypothetical protein n=2 Tax=Leptolyngbya TaxID=47251 RepID=UPI0032999E43